MKIKGYTRSDGSKVKGYNRRKTKAKSKLTKRKRKYTRSQNAAFERSKTSSSGHKSWRKRISDQKSGKGRAGLWANYHAKKHRESQRRKRRK